MVDSSAQSARLINNETSHESGVQKDTAEVSDVVESSEVCNGNFDGSDESDYDEEPPRPSIQQPSLRRTRDE